VAHDPELENEEGRRLDGRNLVEDWLRDKKNRGLRGHYVWNKGQFEAVNPKYIDHLLGELEWKRLRPLKDVPRVIHWKEPQKRVWAGVKGKG
jgi:alkaline phosphatase